MTIIKTKIKTKSTQFAANAKAMQAKVDDLNQTLKSIAEGGGAQACERHVSRGKLLPRDRVLSLLDANTPFMELSPLAAHKVYSEYVPAAGIITGIGQVSGQDCVLVANDATVKGGTYFPLTVKKHLRAQAIAEQNNLPCIYLVDSIMLSCRVLITCALTREHRTFFAGLSCNLLSRGQFESSIIR